MTLSDSWISIEKELPSDSSRSSEKIVLCSTTSGVMVAWLTTSKSIF